MPFTSTATPQNVRGPAGDNGPAGVGVDTTTLSSKNLIVTTTDAVPHDVGTIVGDAGKDGADANLKGTVATVADLPTSGNTTGDAYFVDADGHMYRYDGSTFVDVGSLSGPQGPQGVNGPDGQRGTITTVGTGAPSSALEASALPGDKYIDSATLTVYRFS